jgi:hypothetical protein
VNGGALGITGYYSGRVYDPTVVQNPNSTLTMVFAGYSTPKTAARHRLGRRHGREGALHGAGRAGRRVPHDPERHPHAELDRREPVVDR